MSEIFIEKIFDAPKELALRVWNDPELALQWRDSVEAVVFEDSNGGTKIKARPKLGISKVDAAEALERFNELLKKIIETT